MGCHVLFRHSSILIGGKWIDIKVWKQDCVGDLQDPSCSAANLLFTCWQRDHFGSLSVSISTWNMIMMMMTASVLGISIKWLQLGVEVCCLRARLWWQNVVVYPLRNQMYAIFFCKSEGNNKWLDLWFIHLMSKMSNKSWKCVKKNVDIHN